MTSMDNTPDSPAKTPEGYTTQGGNFWTLITPETWKVLHAVLQGDESFWVVRKHELTSHLERYDTNPIKTSYELLWAELRRPNPSNLTIQNTLRRILENYFKILGDVDPDFICEKFEGKEKFVCKSLFSWVNYGSHFAHDDLFIADGATADIYLKVFKEVFEKLEHGGHYRMMMHEDNVEEAAVEATAQ